MTTTKKVKGTAASIPIGVTAGTSTSLLITFASSAALTWLALEGKVTDRMVGYILMGILLAASVIGALFSAVRIQRRWMLVSLLTGGLYYLILLVSTAVFFGGNYRGIGVTGVLVLVGSLIAGCLGLRANGHRTKGYKKYRTG